MVQASRCIAGVCRCDQAASRVPSPTDEHPARHHSAWPQLSPVSLRFSSYYRRQHTESVLSISRHHGRNHGRFGTCPQVRAIHWHGTLTAVAKRPFPGCGQQGVAGLGWDTTTQQHHSTTTSRSTNNVLSYQAGIAAAMIFGSTALPISSSTS